MIRTRSSSKEYPRPNLNRIKGVQNVHPLNEEDGGKVLVVHVSGKLAALDYKHLVPAFEQLVRRHGRSRVLFDMTGFHGWEAGALWEDIKFDISTSLTSNGWRWSGIRNGNTAWQRSASHSRKRRSDTSIKPTPPRRGSG